MKVKVSASFESVTPILALVFAYKFARWKPKEREQAINRKVPKG